jgi:hypothetical protein
VEREVIAAGTPVTITDAEPRLPQQLYDAFRVAGVFPAGEALPVGQREVSVAMRRQRWLRRDWASDEVEATYLQLVSEDHVLRWELANEADPRRVARRASRRGAVNLARTVIEQFKVLPADGSAIAAMLDGLDQHLNPSRGLRQVRNGQLGPVGAQPEREGRVLLLVHGTFSSASSTLAAWSATEDGRRVLAQAERDHTQVLAYEHATLSVSPILNALELKRAFARSRAKVDVVCHSRGGLVVRWWLEVLDSDRLRDARVVFVGSPLQGTSLAAPNRLRHALDMLTNAAFALGNGGQVLFAAIPWVAAVGGILRVFAAGTGAVSKTPLVDATLAMIPGLAAQARTNNNFELQGLAAGSSRVPPGYRFVVSNFQPVDPGDRWKFWTYYTNLGAAAADAAADFVFDCENDLAVDTSSMTQLAGALSATDKDKILDFGLSRTVHHLNYFDQPKMYAFIQQSLRRESADRAKPKARRRVGKKRSQSA